MSGWKALNIAYKGEYETGGVQDRLRFKKHPYEGFDVLVKWYMHGEFARRSVVSIAREHGNVEYLLEADCNDTSMSYTLRELDDEGNEVKQLSKRIDTGGRGESLEDQLDVIADQIGRRPNLGGNWYKI